MKKKKRIKELEKELKKWELRASEYYSDLNKAYKALPDGETKDALTAKYNGFKFISLELLMPKYMNDMVKKYGSVPAFQWFEPARMHNQNNLKANENE